MMTPNAIEILIHCYCSPTVHPRADAPAVIEELSSLLVNGLIKRNPGEDFYRTTVRGNVHIEQLCGTPWPIASWIDCYGNILKAPLILNPKSIKNIE